MRPMIDQKISIPHASCHLSNPTAAGVVRWLASYHPTNGEQVFVNVTTVWASTVLSSTKTTNPYWMRTDSSA